MSPLLFPSWQVDWDEYNAVCAYLGLTPQEPLFERLDRYLMCAVFRFDRPAGFARFLATRPLTRFTVARLDLTTKWLFPRHPIRHLLTAVIALHECDGRGYAELAIVPAGARVWFGMASWGVGLVLSILVTAMWLAAQRGRYALVGARCGTVMTGKRVLITGVGRGLGMDLMLEALESGAEVIGTVRTQGARDEIRTLLPASAPLRLIVADLEEQGVTVHALDAAGVDSDSLDMAVLCAGIKLEGESVLCAESVRSTFAVNLFAPVEIAAWFCRPVKARALVLISSIGRWHGMHSSCGYNASKAALSIWGESLELELRRAGRSDIAVMIVEPGLFTSGMMRLSGPAGLLAVPRRELAAATLASASARRRSLRYPFWFALATWGVMLAGRAVRLHLFGRRAGAQGVMRERR